MMEWIIDSSVLILVVLLVRQLLKNRIGPRLRYALWAVVLVRLLLPFSIGSTELSVMNTAERVPMIQAAETVRGVQSIEHAHDGSVQGFERYGIMPDYPVEVTPHSTPEEFHQMETALRLRDVLEPTWKLGTLVMLAVLLLSNLAFARKLRKSRRKLEQSEIPLRVYVADVDTPCLFGVLRPTVYVTEEAAESASTLRHAITHEYTHFLQGDHVWAFLRGVALSIHWYNPLVWLAAFLSRQDGELSCDEGTVRRLGEEERADYGRTLLHLTCEKRESNPFTAATTMTGSHSAIRERIVLLTRHPRTTALVLALVVLLTAVAAGCTFTGSKKETDVTLYQMGKLTAAIPKEYEDLLTVEVGDGRERVLLAISETTSMEQARADGEDPEEWGWICTLVAYDRAEFEQSLIGDAPGLQYIARTEDTYYALCEPTDVRLYRSGGEWDEEALAQWERANGVTPLLTEDFVTRNHLTPFTWDDIQGPGAHAYEGVHLAYTWTPLGDPDDQLKLILSQPAKQGEGGIWCVERMEYTQGYGSSYWFPDTPGMDSLTYYAGVQQEHDAGTRTDHATPEAAMEVFFRENPFLSPDTRLQDGILEPVELAEMPERGDDFSKVTTYQCGDYTAALPDGVIQDLLLVEPGNGREDGVLLSVYEKRSVEAARAERLENPESYGWLFSLVRCDQKTFEQQLVAGWPDMTWFAVDNQGHYFLLATPTDCRIYRGKDQTCTDADFAEWERCSSVGGPALLEDFITRNHLTAFDTGDLSHGQLYDGPHRYFLVTPGQDPMNHLLVTLSQPVKPGEGGIWCVERYVSGLSPWSNFWFPDHGEDSALDYYKKLQKDRDRGRDTGFDTPEEALETFFAQAPSWVQRPTDGAAQITELGAGDPRILMSGIHRSDLMDTTVSGWTENSAGQLAAELMAAAAGPMVSGGPQYVWGPELSFRLPEGGRLVLAADRQQTCTMISYEHQQRSSTVYSSAPELWDWMKRTVNHG